MILSRYVGHRNARSSSRPTPRRWLSVESLEGRALLSTFTVTNNNDSGAGSLRQALISSNGVPGTGFNTINFAIGSGVQTISLQSALPAVVHAVTVNGSSQPGTGTTPQIVLSGTNAGTGTSGLTLDASGITVEGVAIVNFSGSGIVVSGASAVTISGDDIGVSSTGAAAGNTQQGIVFENCAQDNTVTASSITANGDSGILIEGNSTGNIIGGTATGTGNVISGNGARGVHITNSNNNVVEGNLIGTTGCGSALGNGDSGVLIDTGSTGNVIGGTIPGAGNVISDNGARGVHITGSNNNLVEGNLIGTTPDGSTALGNGDSGVLIDTGATGNVIGGTATGAGNVISGNVYRGVNITNANNNLVEGNLIGTNASGTALGNGKVLPHNACSGVLIYGTSSGNVIGGTIPAAANVISGNGYAGVHIDGAIDNLVEGNLIGTAASGAPGLENVIAGVLIDTGAKGNTIGGTTAGAANTIENNLDGGVVVNGASNSLIEDNVISANGFGQPAAGLGDGVSLASASGTVITGNTIDSNRDWGIDSRNSSGSVLTGNTFAGNGLGTTDID